MFLNKTVTCNIRRPEVRRLDTSNRWQATWSTHSILWIDFRYQSGKELKNNICQYDSNPRQLLDKHSVSCIETHFHNPIKTSEEKIKRSLWLKTNVKKNDNSRKSSRHFLDLTGTSENRYWNISVILWKSGTDQRLSHLIISWTRDHCYWEYSVKVTQRLKRRRNLITFLTALSVIASIFFPFAKFPTLCRKWNTFRLQNSLKKRSDVCFIKKWWYNWQICHNNPVTWVSY